MYALSTFADSRLSDSPWHSEALPPPLRVAGLSPFSSSSFHKRRSTGFLQMVGVPGFFVALMRLSTVWPKLTALAQTLPYDGVIVRDYQKGRLIAFKKWDWSK
jgi:hypothetical protein